MKHFQVFKSSCAAGLFSSNGLTCKAEAEKAVSEIKETALNKGAFITFWNGEKVTFTVIYNHTVKVPAKALKDLTSLKEWIISRVDYYFQKDAVKVGISL